MSIPVLDVVNDHSCFSDSKHDPIVLEVIVEIGLGPQLLQHVDIDVPSIRHLRLVQQRCGALDDTGLPHLHDTSPERHGAPQDNCDGCDSQHGEPEHHSGGMGSMVLTIQTILRIKASSQFVVAVTRLCTV